MKRLLPLALLALAGCGEEAREEQTAAAPEAAAEPAPLTLAAEGPRFAGRWAPDLASCTTDWWRFWRDELLTGEADLRCTILPPDARASDTEVRALCSEDGAATRETWTIAYEDVSPPRMTLTRREDIQAITLVRCA